MLSKIIGVLLKKFPADTLYLSGGVALNVVANERIKKSNLFKEIILNGSVEDNGTAIGAAIAANLSNGYQRKFSIIKDYYGKIYQKDDLIKAISNFNLSYEVLPEDDYFVTAAKLIKQEKIIGWFQGQSEFGPRALGNRSILANPLSSHTKYILDLIIQASCAEKRNNIQKTKLVA